MAKTALALTVVVSALALSGCARIDAQEYSDERTESATIAEIVLAGGAGDVTVNRGEGSTIRIQRTFRYHDKHQPGGRDRFDGSLLRLDTDCGNGCSVSYTVTVPNEVKISGHNDSGLVVLNRVGAVALRLTSGGLTIRGAAGNIAVQAGSGAIDIADTKGTVTATAGSGSVRIVGAGGVVVATTRSGKVDVENAGGDTVTAGASSGDVSVTVSKPQAVRAQTSSGGIRVVVRSGLTVAANTSTRSGHTTVSVPTAADAPGNLNLTTLSGDISVVPEGVPASGVPGAPAAPSASPASPPSPAGP